MRFKLFMSVALLTIISFTSCKKNDNPDPTFSIEGTWVGKYSILSQPYNNHYSFAIKPGNVLELLNEAKQKVGAGTWELDGIIFTATYTLSPPNSGTFSVIASFNKNTGKLDGTWGEGQQEYGGGYWFMNKTN